MQQGKTSRLNSYEENPAFLTKRWITHQRAELKRKLSLETLENAMHKFSLPSLKLEGGKRAIMFYLKCPKMLGLIYTVQFLSHATTAYDRPMK